MHNTKKTIAVVEDQHELLANYRTALEKHGYATVGLSDRAAAEAYFDRQLPDLVLLDIGLGQDADAGFELCQRLRQQSARLPILMLTARDDEIDVVSGLRLGADDYLSKDISLAHLLARISTLFRRLEVLQSTGQTAIRQGRLNILKDNMQVSWDDQAIDVTVTEFWMILSLARYPGQVKTRDQLMDDANIYVDYSTITSHIKRIRKKFQALDADFDCIKTVHGMGYRWEP